MRYLLLSLFFHFILTCSAQVNFQPGYIVRTSGDTLRGFIDEREWDKNPGIMTFSSSGQEKQAQEFAIRQVQYFEVGTRSFQRYTVSISMDKMEARQGSIEGLNQVVTDTVWLEVLQRGKNLSLFSYRDAVKIRFYILESGSTTPEELVYKLKVVWVSSTEPERLTYFEGYKNQLINAALKAGKLTDGLRWKVNKTLYSKEILKVVSEINEVSSRAAKKGPSGSHWFGGIGLTASTLTYSGGSFGKNATNTGPSYFPYVQAGFEYTGRTGKSKLRVQGDLMLTKAKNQTNATDNSTPGSPQEFQYNYTQNLISFSALAKYLLYNQEHIKLYLAAGVRLNAAQYSENKYTLTGYSGTTTYTDWLHLNTFWPSIPLKAGVYLGKFEISACYTPKVPLNQSTYLLKADINYFQAGVAMHFK